MTTVAKQILVCRTCGGQDVQVDAYAAWNVDEQKFDLLNTYDKGSHCEDCDGETRTEFVDVFDYTVFVRSSDDKGTTFIQSILAKDVDDAMVVGAKACAEAWETDVANVKCVGVADGDVTIAFWQDITDD